MKNRENCPTICHYRKAVFKRYFELATQTPVPDFTLEEAVQLAVSTKIEKEERIYRKIDEKGYIETLDIYDNKGLTKITPRGCSGIIHTTRCGDMVPASSQTAFGATLVPAQLMDEHNEPKDPAANITCFAIIGDHVAYFSQSPGADIRLACFFNNLLKEQTDTLNNFFTVELEPLFNQNVRERVKKFGVKKILINSNTTANVADSVVTKIKEIFTSRNGKDDRFVAAQRDRNAKIHQCHFVCVVSADNIERGLKQQALGEYISSLSDEQLLELKLILGDNSRVAEGEVSTCGQIQVEYNKGVMNYYSAKRALGTWLKNALSNGTIS